MANPEGLPREKSTVEIYRTPGNVYEREPLPYDLTDPLDLGVWTALVMYVQRWPVYREGEEYEGSGYGGYGEAHLRPFLRALAPFELEQDLGTLAENVRARFGDSSATTPTRLGLRDGQATALAALAALFPTQVPAPKVSKVSEATKHNVYWGGHWREETAPMVPADLWKTASEYLELPGTQGEVAPDPRLAAYRGYDDPRSLQQVLQGLQARPLASVVYMARMALRDTLTQSAASRKLGVSPARLKVLVDQGRFRHLRVGRTVLLLEDEILLDANYRRRKRAWTG